MIHTCYPCSPFLPPFEPTPPSSTYWWNDAASSLLVPTSNFKLTLSFTNSLTSAFPTHSWTHIVDIRLFLFLFYFASIASAFFFFPFSLPVFTHVHRRLFHKNGIFNNIQHSPFNNIQLTPTTVDDTRTHHRWLLAVEFLTPIPILSTLNTLAHHHDGGRCLCGPQMIYAHTMHLLRFCLLTQFAHHSSHPHTHHSFFLLRWW